MLQVYRPMVRGEPVVPGAPRRLGGRGAAQWVIVNQDCLPEAGTVNMIVTLVTAAAVYADDNTFGIDTRPRAGKRKHIFLNNKQQKKCFYFIFRMCDIWY